MRHDKNKMHISLGSYIIIFFLIGVIVAVALFIFLPRVDYDQAFNNVAKAQVVYDEKNINRKSLDENLTLISNMSLNSTNQTRLQCYITLISILNDSNAICLNALIGVDTKSDYNSFVSEQNSRLQNFINYKTQLAFHITNSMNEIFRMPTPSSTVVNEYVGPFLEKLHIFVQHYANFYLATSTIIENCSLRGLENNELVITANKGINLAIQRILDKSNINNYAYDIDTLKDKATIMFDEHFYFKYYTQEYTVEEINQILNQIA